jgi:DNA polymerase I-like protein with 3'-5' exonuclease and polymerase domains
MKTRKVITASTPIQTVPKKKEYRECFVASPDHMLVIHDYSSQEPRILAYVTQDPKLIQIFMDKKDIYIEIGFEIFGERFDKKDPRRNDMKSVVLGVSYGLTKYGLANKLNENREEENYISVDGAQELLDTFFDRFPVTDKFVRECGIWKPNVSTILGRKFWGNPYKNGWERNYQNHPCQGSAVDCTKMATVKIRNRLGYNPCIIFMHDELVCDVPIATLEHDAKVIEDTMVEVQEWMHPGIPGGVEQFIGKNWSAKK